jgi:cytochrome c oxidase cbb3-type subunit III
MTHKTRLIAVVVLAGAAMGSMVLAQGTTPSTQGQQAPPQTQTPPPQPQTQAPPPAQEPPPGRGAGGGGGRQGGGRRGGFTQYTRPLASPDVLLRGKAVYETNCASCHATDLRGVINSGSNLLRSGVALNDQQGELITAAIAGHTPTINLVTADSLAVAEYIHSVHATMGGQGSPPGRNPTNVTLNVLVGDAKSGEALFGTMCASCHSVTGNLKGVGAKFADARALQNAWVSGQGGTFGGGGRGGGGGGNPAIVTLANGTKIEGVLVRKDDFLVVLRLPDGTRRSFARTDGVPRVDVIDPNAAHKKMAMELAFSDPDNKKMHDITAYLSTIK